MSLIEAVSQTAPANILGQDFLFFRGGEPLFAFQPFQKPDGFHIGGISLTGSTHTQIIVMDAEVAALIIRDGGQQHCGGCFLSGLRCRGRKGLGVLCDAFLNFIHSTKNLFVLPSVHLQVVLHDGIDTIFTLQKVQTSGKGHGVADAQGFHLVRR